MTNDSVYWDHTTIDLKISIKNIVIFNTVYWGTRSSQPSESFVSRHDSDGKMILLGRGRIFKHALFNH